MIKVEEVLNKNAKEESDKLKNAAGQQLPGSVKEVSRSYAPWIAVINLAALAAWFFFFRKKGSGTNEGISG